MFVAFPFNVKFVTSGFHVFGASSEPKQSIGGAFSVQPRLGAHWRGAVTFLTTNDETTLAVQAFVAGMEGMLGTTVVPVFQRYRPRDLQGRLAPQQAVAPLGDALMYEGSGSETAEFWGFEQEPAIYGNVASSAALRATEMVIAKTNVSDLRPGHDISIGQRLYRAKAIWPSGPNYRVSITPPLRESAPYGTVVAMDAPRCLMRFASEAEGQLVYQPGPVASITMNFVEAI